MKSSSVSWSAKTAPFILAAALLTALSSHTTAAVVVLPDVTITSLDHSYSYDPLFGFGFMSDGVAIPSGIGSYTTTSFTGQVLAGDTIEQHILAPAGMQFVFNHEPSLDFQGLAFNVYWSAGGDSATVFATPTFTFQNATGTVPTPSYNYGTVGNAGNFIKFEYQADIAADFSFTGLTVSFSVLNSPPAGSRTFNIGSNSNPSIYAYGGSSLSGDVTLMSLESLTAVPEPTTIIVWAVALVAVACGAKRLQQLTA